MKVKTCDYCGKPFEYVKDTARFCSASCRVGYHNRGNRIEQKLSEVVRDVEYIAETLRKNPTMAEGFADKLKPVKRALGQLNESYMFAKGEAAKGRQVVRACGHCGQTIFGFENQLPRSCDYCGKPAKWIEPKG